MVAASITLVAQRGNAAELPPNTLPACASALALGAAALSVDVQLCSDLVPVTLRDVDLRRAGTGRDGSVLDLPAAEVIGLEVAERERFSDRHAGVCIPRLADLAALLRPLPNTTLFVTLHRASLARFGHRRVARAVLDAVAPVQHQCVLVSCEFAAILEARREGADRIGWILDALDPHAQLKSEALQPQFLGIDAAKLPAGARPWRGPWAWGALEVLTPADARQLAARGLTWIHSARVRGMLRELGVARPMRPSAGE